MVQVYSSPTVVTVQPKEGELQIKLDITINLNHDGTLATAEIKSVEKKQEKVDLMIPDFSAGTKLNFGKIVKE